MTANLLTRNSSKTEFLLIGLKQQFAKLHDCSLKITHSARNLGFIFDVCLYLDLKTASTIATSIVHSKYDFCNSLYFNLPKSLLNRLHLIKTLFPVPLSKPLNSLILKYLHWLKINERINYKLLSLTRPYY